MVFFDRVKILVRTIVLVVLFCVPFLTTSFSQNIFFHRYWVSGDKLSVFLVLLSLWVTLLMILSMNKSKGLRSLLSCFTVLNLILVFSFFRKRLLGFYIFFELSLIPTLLIILGWGIQPERIRAGRYLMIYTLLGSLPLLCCIVYMDFHCGSIKMFLPTVEIFFFRKFDYSILCFFWIFAFLVKLPIYGVHLWLPKAHVEAPVAGSMVLAGLLLKLGAYGLVRSFHYLYIDICF